MSKKLLISTRKTTVFLILLALLLNCFIFSENADTVFAEEWDSLIEAEQLPEDQEDTVEETVQDTGSAKSVSDEMLSAKEEQSTDLASDEEKVLSAEEEQSAEPDSDEEEGLSVEEEQSTEPISDEIIVQEETPEEKNCPGRMNQVKKRHWQILYRMFRRVKTR